MTRALRIRRAAVLGAGVMGRGIAAHLAGAGIPVLLLDIVPPGEKSADPAARNRFAAAGLQAALKNKPALFYDPDDARLITVGNFEDDFDRLAEVDWIIEVVKEDLDIKRDLFARVDAVRKPGALVTSNTSGLPLASLVRGRSEDFRRNFLITHFFNPVRYMKLLEVVQGPDTDDDLVDRFTAFARQRLGKGVVHAKDSPAFIANRIGTFSMMYTVHRMLEEKRSPEFVDAIFGQPAGRPKSAVFRTADLVGLDTLALVAEHLHEALTDDEMRRYFEVPAFLKTLIERGWLGAKSGQGCYKKTPEGILAFDPYTLEYRPQEKPRFASVGAAKKAERAGARIKALVSGDDEAARFAWDVIAQTLAYAARHLEDIATDLVQVDNAMRWGFNHDLGPFETWDALGVPETVERMKADGIDVPAWVDEMLAAGRTSFYKGEPGKRTFWHPEVGQAAREVVSPRFRRLPTTVQDPSLVAKNGSARLWDIGDGIYCVEFDTKMNAIDPGIIEMLGRGIDEAEANGRGLVIGNHGESAFSAGANLLLIYMAIQQKDWKQIDQMAAALQAVARRMHSSEIPVVAAPFGLTLGGGAEVAMAADAIQAHAELYMGLVEVGVGLVPAGGGCFALLHNVMAGAPADADPVSYLKDAFMTIGMAKVGTGAEHSRRLGFLRPDDRITMDRDELLEAAKRRAIGLAESDYVPAKPRRVRVGGTTGFATIYSALWGMQQSHHISEHDLKIGRALARVMTGGDVPAGTWVDEERMHELEREAFLSLCGEPKTQERIQHMLMNNKPLRN